MNTIPEEALSFLRNNRIGVLAIEMLDGAPHGATLHFAHVDDPFVFYFKTSREYRKAGPITHNLKTRASFVVGMSEDEMKTLQLDGYAEVTQGDEVENFNKVFFGKFLEKAGKPENPKDLFFKFTPTWWRFTDWKTAEGKKIWVSE